MASTETVSPFANDASNDSSSPPMIEDSVNPFFLGSGDNLGVQLVSHRLIGAQNYSTLSRSMIISLTAKNKIGFINGKISAPDSCSSQIFVLWIRCNMTVLGWVINSISPEIASSMMYTDNARDIWLNMHERGQILLYEPLPNINKVLSLVLQKEKQRSLKNGGAMNSVMAHPIETTTLYSNANSNAKVNHSGKGNSMKDGPVYNHCGKIRHVADKCYRPHGFPPGFKFKGKSVANHFSSSHQAASVTASGASTSQSIALNASPTNFTNNLDRSDFNSTNWIIDIGATNHIVHFVAILISITCISNSYVYLPNGEKALVSHIGTVKLTETLILTEVLVVPFFTFNLISVSHLNKSVTCLIFLGIFFFIQDLAHWSMIGLGRE
uniref:Retrotransposon Copia-like N-terminal domain-containing protein n=1 Tax=Quercus lobata TaxID=97700 RepID=A0A7N2LCX6_QUELO